MNRTNEEKILAILAEMQGSMLSMNNRMDSLDGRMDSMEAGLNARMDSLEQGLSARMDSLDGRMDSLDGRMDSLDGRMDSLDGRMDSLESKIDTMDNRIVKIEFKLETDFEVKMDALAEGHSAILEQLVPTSRVDKLEDRVEFLEAMLRRAFEELQQLKKAQ